MSTVRLKKPYESHAEGAVISVPYGVGRTLIADGTAEYPDAAGTIAGAVPNNPADSDRLKAEHATALASAKAEHATAMQKLKAEHAAELNKLKDENARLALELEQSTKTKPDGKK